MSFAWTSPYADCWIERFFPCMYRPAFDTKVKGEADFRRKLAGSDPWPGVLAMWNFIVERAGVESLCTSLNINRVHVEDGWFPHYGAAHADPLGFSWESSLPRMRFQQTRDAERINATVTRNDWLKFSHCELPASLKKPFVIWPLQLLGDKVNRMDLNASDWTPFIMHFRASLPGEFQLAIKPHPISSKAYVRTLETVISGLPNTVLLPHVPRVDLKSLLSECAGAAGVNSTVLFEARLMFNKPTYVYGRSWFTNHTDLFLPVQIQFPPRTLPRIDFLENPASILTTYLADYSDWFLSQLLARQVSLKRESANPEDVRRKVQQLSFQSYSKYGDDVFRFEPNRQPITSIGSMHVERSG